MAKKAVERIVSELKKLMVAEKLVLGSERTIKLLRDKKVSKVFLASKCGPSAREEVVHLCKINKIPLEELQKSGEEIGVICRKPFSISVIGVL